MAGVFSQRCVLDFGYVLRYSIQHDEAAGIIFVFSDEVAIILHLSVCSNVCVNIYVGPQKTGRWPRLGAHMADSIKPLTLARAFCS